MSAVMSLVFGNPSKRVKNGNKGEDGVSAAVLSGAKPEQGSLLQCRWGRAGPSGGPSTSYAPCPAVTLDSRIYVLRMWK